MGQRVLVCGSRRYGDGFAVFRCLDAMHAEDPIDLIIEGGANGADRLARVWAVRRDIPVDTYIANWAKYGRAAGPRRNIRMIREGEPDLVVAFPLDGDLSRSHGTAFTVSQAHLAGIQVHVHDLHPDLLPQQGSNLRHSE